jgi:hypothetical protein
MNRRDHQLNRNIGGVILQKPLNLVRWRRHSHLEHREIKLIR